jgi:rubredoxin
MTKQLYVCRICGHIYNLELGDPGRGITPGTPFSEIDHDWVCPVYKKTKRFFYLLKRDHYPAYQSVEVADLDKVLLS